jgi:hypothetical protein
VAGPARRAGSRRRSAWSVGGGPGRRRDHHAGHRRAEYGDRGRGDRRLVVPDRLGHQGLDRDRPDAACRTGPGRAGHPGRAGAAGLPRRGPQGERADHGAASTHPYVRDRRRLLPRHRPGRRLPRALRGRLRRAGAGAPGRSDDVLLQHRLRGAGPDRGTADRPVLGRRAARTADRAARPGPQPDVAGGGAALPRRTRPRDRSGRRAAPGGDLGDAAQSRARPARSTPPPRTYSASPGCTWPAGSARTAPGC